MSDIKITDEEADRLNEEHDKAQLKHRFIEASYTTTVEWDLEEEEIQWDKVEEYWIKYGILNITYKDGTKQVEENWGDISIDYKHNFEEALVLDDGFAEVEGTR